MFFFEKHELAHIKQLTSPPGLRLMGFKPKSALKVYHHVKHPYFIYPDEKNINGSTTAFAALHRAMIAADKIAICRMLARVGYQPRFVALLPQEEVLDNLNFQVIPPGFHLIQLPYADDIRHIAVEQPPDVDVKEIIKAKKLVKSLRIAFDSRDFENPALQKHYANLQALALDRETVEEPVDYTLPDEAGMQKFAEVITDFKDTVYSDEYKQTFLVKEVAEDAGDGEIKKEEKSKKEVSIEGIDWEQIANTDQIKKVTVPQLKAYLKLKGVKHMSNAKKDELIEKLRNQLNLKAK